MYQGFEKKRLEELWFAGLDHKTNQQMADTSQAMSITRMSILHNLNQDGWLEGWIRDQIV